MKTKPVNRKEEKIMYLSQAIKDDIMVSKKEMAQGLFTTHEDLDKEIKAWLKSDSD